MSHTATHRRPGAAARPQRSETGSAVRRTLATALASALGIVALKGLFVDWLWLPDVWLTMAVVLAPAVLMRRVRRPGALDIWPGIVLMIPWLTARFLSGSAGLGFLPTTGTWTQLGTLMTQLHETTRLEVAPIHTTPAVRLVVCALAGLLAALIDLLAVVGRRGALAGVPLLVVYTVAGAVPRTPVAWTWFVVGAIAYLVLLSLDSTDDLDHWGTRVSGPRGRSGRRARTAAAVAAPRIAVVAVAVAVVLPLVVPADARNLLANALHGNGGGIAGFGGGGDGSSGRISPFANLRGQLERRNPVQLATVQMLGTSRAKPYYLRTNVLSELDDTGWSVGSHGALVAGNTTFFPAVPSGMSSGSVQELTARISISRLRGNAPVFDRPVNLRGLGDVSWSPQDQLVGGDVTDGTTYTEQFEQQAPTAAELTAAGDYVDPAVRSQLTLPADLPRFVRNLVGDIVGGSANHYARARAISDFFADPVNGFVYDLSTAVGDSGSVLVDFLQKRRGYCQQYAATMAVLLRAAGVPARVVLGYMHRTPDASGSFDISTADAHAWTEAWFAGIGWVPFNPTPASGLADGGANDLAWAPKTFDAGTAPSDHPSGSASPLAPASSAPSTGPAAPNAAPTAAAVPSAAGGPSTSWVVLAGLGAVLVLALLPALSRVARRRRRYAAAGRTGDADVLWDELSDTARDLGYVWSPARTPRQVAGWLALDAPAHAGTLHALAQVIEQQRYAPSSQVARLDELGRDMRAATEELRAHRSTRTRLVARLLPASSAVLQRVRRGRRRSH